MNSLEKIGRLSIIRNRLESALNKLETLRYWEPLAKTLREPENQELPEEFYLTKGEIIYSLDILDYLIREEITTTIKDGGDYK